MTTAQSIWSKSLTARQARMVGTALREAGYKITNAEVWEKRYILTIGDYLQPLDRKAREKLYTLICEAAGIVPNVRN